MENKNKDIWEYIKCYWENGCKTVDLIKMIKEVKK